MINVGDFAISLDKREQGSDMDFVSHAHSDHISAVKKSESVLASTETLDLIKGAYGYEPKKKSGASEKKEAPKFGLIDSGHMLGSKQLVVDSDNAGKIVYTGDFQMQKCRVANPIKIESCDTLIVDSTYPTTEIKFDERTEIECSIQKWTAKKLEKGIVLFNAYAMGKAQELIAILNEASLVPVVSNKIAKISEVYKSRGFGLEYIPALEKIREKDRQSSNFVLISEKPLYAVSANLTSRYGRRVFTAIASGFAKKFVFDTDVQFPLSDHADFYQCLEYVKECGAKQVLTYGREAETLAENLGKEGITARPFNSII